MVYFRLEASGDPDRLAERLVAAMRERGILINPPDKGEYRFVTHYWVDRARVEATAKAFAEALAAARA
jgi:threonine aldolase